MLKRARTEQDAKQGERFQDDAHQPLIGAAFGVANINQPQSEARVRRRDRMAGPVA